MKVKELMTAGAQACSPSTSLAGAAATMWSSDCGVIPVLDEKRKVVGIISDRDICIAAGTRVRPTSELLVGDVMSTKVRCCSPEDDVRVALKSMAEEQVRRLPVVGADGTLAGILSINDVVLVLGTPKVSKADGPSADQVIETLKAVCRHRPKAKGSPAPKA